MASRSKQKEEARARRLAEEQARASKARRERRLRMVGGIVLAAIAIVVVLVVVSSSNSGRKETGLQTGTSQSKTVSEVNSLFSGIPQSGTTLGHPKAPVTLTYYGDLECPVCQEFTLAGGFPKLVANEVRQGKVKVDYKSFETATRDPNVFKEQQVAAEAAGQQNKFWDYADLFYHEQGQEDTGYVTDSYLQGLADQLPGLNKVKWEAARNNSTLATQVASDVSAGNQAGVSGTPTLIMSGPKGQAVASQAVPTYPQLQQLIQKVQ